jgi:CheY-like chemotaxis protein
MNLSYRILWFEDENDFIELCIPEIKNYIEDIGFKFLSPHVENDNSKADNLDYDNYDLILMDYKLSDGDKGDVIIDKIRSMNVYTEIIFYSSSKMEDLRLSIQKNGLDGVYCANRGEGFIQKVKDIIKQTLKKVLDINTIRGIVMASVSDFDQKMVEIIETYKNHKNEEEYSAYLQKRKNKLDESLNSRAKSIKKIAPGDIIYERDFDTYHKWRAVSNIVRDNFPHLAETTEAFKIDVIDIRNPLAHVIEKDDPRGNGKKCLMDGDFIFNDEKSRQILENLKKHEKNLDSILNRLKCKPYAI